MPALFRRIHFSVSISAGLTLVAGMTLTLVLFASVRRIESERHNLQFGQSAMVRTAAVAAGVLDAVEQLMIVNQLFRSIDRVSREQFHTFTTPLLQRYPQIQALSFQRVVANEDRAAFEASMQAMFPGFMISEIVDGQKRRAGVRDSYNVVEYIEPREGNLAAFGLDTAVSMDKSQARLRSRSNGRITATSLLSLAQYQGFHTGFLMVAPVYRNGTAPVSPQERLRAVVGETAVVFRIDHLIDTILRNGGFLNMPGMAIRIYAGPGTKPDDLAFQHGTISTVGDAIHGSLRWLIYDRADPVSAPLDVAGSRWHMDVSQAAKPFTAAHNGSLFALLGGLLSSLLATAYVYSLVTRIAIIERVTGERTAALQFANLRLAEDLALRVHTEKSLRLHERVIEVAANAIIICSAQAPDYAVEYVNPAFERLTGYRASDVVGRQLESLQSAHHDQQNIEEIRAALREKREGHVMLRNYRKDGMPYWSDLFIAPVKDEGGEIGHFVVAQYDITAVMRYEAELEFQANHDVLTGLANRKLLRERLTHAIADADRIDSPLWVVFVDFDRFKFVNDTLGHEAGDGVLQTLAGRLQSAAREADTVARLGGDEFVLVLPGLGDKQVGQSILKDIMEAVALPLVTHDHEFFFTCSIGVAIYPGDGGTAESLTKHADIAMYRAKELGRNAVQFYTPMLNARTLDRLSIEADLRHALARDEFVVHYQPQIDLRSGQIVGMEALIRWNHPVHGMIAPMRFIGLAEEMGLIIPIGDWVVRTACTQTKAWHDAGLGELRVAVNLSPRQFTQKALVQSIADILRSTNLDARFLELELTESLIMSDVENGIAILRSLKALGIQISIDDFGTGYSSLSYLRRLPIDILKIDQSFVKDLSVDPDDAAIVVSIITLAHSLRLKVIAEGVETAEQLAFLREHGCDQMQGYYFSRPLGPQAFEMMLQEGCYIAPLANGTSQEKPAPRTITVT
jgi:diguanylate cyclase (GGDEF)-like protein/PAS domain S-box-containing protein